MKKRILFLIVFALNTSLCFSHEEPAKTLAEKKEKEKTSSKVSASKIKSATVWKLAYTKGVEKPVKSKTLRILYDLSGRMTAIEAYRNDSLTESVEYGFSATGDMLTDTDFDRGHKILEKNTFAYDAEGRVISGFSVDAEGKDIGSFVITKSEDRKTLTFIKYKGKDTLEYKLIYSYKTDCDQSDFTEASKYDANGTLMMKVEKEYNAAGLQKKKSVFDASAKLLYYFQYEYDKTGNMTKVSKLLPDGTKEWSDDYFYDRNGNCTRLMSYDKEKKLKTEIHYEFEYYK